VTLAELISTDRVTISVEEAASLLEVSRGVAYACHRDGSLPGALTLGRRRLVSVPALRRALGLSGDAPTGEHTGAP
jgi:excisionase family DNA binding protein